MEKVIPVSQVCEKSLANGKDLFWEFMDLEKAYDTIDQLGMWKMLRVHGVGGKLCPGGTCVRVGNDVSE